MSAIRINKALNYLVRYFSILVSILGKSGQYLVCILGKSGLYFGQYTDFFYTDCSCHHWAQPPLFLKPPLFSPAPPFKEKFPGPTPFGLQNFG